MNEPFGRGARNPTASAALLSIEGDCWDSDEPKRRTGEFVYFFHMPERKRIKIGWTRLGPRQRLAGVRSGRPERIELIGSIDGNRQVEKLMHAKFRRYHIEGEWFEDIILANVYRLIADDVEWFNGSAV